MPVRDGRAKRAQQAVCSQVHREVLGMDWSSWLAVRA